VFRGDPSEGKFIAFWLASDVIAAAMNANVWDAAGPIQHLIRDKVTVSADELSDVDTPLAAVTHI
jgi:3-phenylpropionate/trans-cinnamate dioxygenase ferredoxin reductase subunit